MKECTCGQRNLDMYTVERLRSLVRENAELRAELAGLRRARLDQTEPVRNFPPIVVTCKGEKIEEEAGE